MYGNAKVGIWRCCGLGQYGLGLQAVCMVVTVSTWVRVYGFKTSYSTFHTMWLIGRVAFNFCLQIQTSMHLI